MEASKNVHTYPMRGTIERETRARVAKAKAVQAVIAGLQQQTPPQPERQEQVVIERTEVAQLGNTAIAGFDIDGNYHYPGEA